MIRLAEIEAHIAGMDELRDIVGAMRSLASMRVQEAHRSLPSIRHYAETMAAAIGAALLVVREGPPAARAAPGRRALVMCTAEHGFVGAFNHLVLDAAEAVLDPDDALLVLGSRGAALAQERGRPPVWAQPMATRPDSVPETIRRLAAELYRAVADGEVTRVEVIFARHRPGSPLAIERRRLFPVDFAAVALTRARPPPLHNLPAETLLEKLIADYVFALLFEAAVESLASENAARFAAMESAHDNVSKKLDTLRQDARQARQDEITTELLDLVTGALALA
ncbi:MAG TPA: FoF1 ATP synthase subunit gamma [Stellaceae bacterium]|nr:FoF1 ATP synthase subunit gamma [Stellaceae bacterium]